MPEFAHLFPKDLPLFLKAPRFLRAQIQGPQDGLDGVTLRRDGRRREAGDGPLQRRFALKG
ncbi:hypothetical protein [Deinococcus peraridilitoris]|uniref:hypothetical protein n=1 Tax=Deinococcus peraridilitoris TaxID=432329 RepID=UPI001FE15851|nr:hypothetical protein [Deinococcus peraridilitoris]